MSNLSHNDRLRLYDKISLINWGLVLLVAVLGGIGIGLLYSAGGKSWNPWAQAQMTRLVPGLFAMILVALVDVRFWLRIAYPLYGVMLLLLVVVEVMGHVGMGAQRWINFGAFVLQPSEPMKLALILALARYFHALDLEDIARPTRLFWPVLMTVLPVGLVLLQPNLGTATLLTATAAGIFFAAGVKWWKFALVIVLFAACVPYAWGHLHDYQKARVLTFLHPESDPLGAGYNIIQSQIALGSGGLWGRGFGMGTQSQLQFLPERHTDFIFVVLAEEFGMIGAFVVLGLYFLLFAYGYAIALASRCAFGRFLAFGLTTTFFLYVFVNVAMVTGLIPVVGIPMPLVSYGGTAMITLLIGCGLLLSVSVHREARISRTGL